MLWTSLSLTHTHSRKPRKHEGFRDGEYITWLPEPQMGTSCLNIFLPHCTDTVRARDRCEGGRPEAAADGASAAGPTKQDSHKAPQQASDFDHMSSQLPGIALKELHEGQFLSCPSVAWQGVQWMVCNGWCAMKAVQY
eukprot:1138272-Pelagomonas_calceolata.AAC.13